MGLKLHVMLLEFKCCGILLLSSYLTNALSSHSPSTKFLPLPHIITFTCPLVAINQLRANIKGSVVRLSATSRCNVLVVKQTNKDYLISFV